MKRIFLILLLISAISVPPSAFAVERCPQCDRKISRASFYRAENMTFCSRKCADQWRKDDRPKCPVCLKPVASADGRSGGIVFCSDRCRKRAAGVCFICHDHKQERQLSKFDDGLQVCRECMKKGLYDASAAGEEFAGVRNVLKERFGLHAPGKVKFTLCGEETIRKLQKRKSDNTNGLCLMYSDGRREIYLRRGMPLKQFRAVAAHELAHDWFNVFVRRRPSAEVMEGWAEFVSWHYCDIFRYRNEQKMIENNGIKTYSDGFRKMKSKLKIRMGKDEFIRRLSEFPEE